MRSGPVPWCAGELGSVLLAINGHRGMLCAVFFGVTAAVALKFWEVEPAAGLLLLGYAAFGAALLNWCLDASAGVEVRRRDPFSHSPF